ncbi:hypothetical protein ACFWWA_15610 [Streptomyces goshikiensis]|uniref:hypothetical protein n=1 Tax=Streptomyces goshikiensis TaxID=1942 RepID=UPI003646E686
MITAGAQEAVSVDPRQRMDDYQTMAVSARMKVHAALAAAGLEPDEADELVCAMEAGAVAGAHCWVEELPGCAPDAHGTAYGGGWDGAVDRALELPKTQRRVRAAACRGCRMLRSGARTPPRGTPTCQAGTGVGW